MNDHKLQNVLFSDQFHFLLLIKCIPTGSARTQVIKSTDEMMIKINVVIHFRCDKKYLSDNKFPGTPTIKQKINKLETPISAGAWIYQSLLILLFVVESLFVTMVDVERFYKNIR